MKQNDRKISNPTIGCKLGKAYSILLTQLSDALSAAGLDISTGEYLVLRALYNTDGLRQCEIADIIGKDKASVCRTVATLESRGYISTTLESHKCRRAFLTPKARDIEARIIEVATSRHDALLALGSPREIEAFVDILDKIILTH